MTGRAIDLLVFAAVLTAAGLYCGRRWGRWSCRLDYADGWDAGLAAERERWEGVTGATYERLAAEAVTDVPDVPGNDGWPFGHREFEQPPTTEVLMAEAVAQGYTERVPSVAEMDELADRYQAAHAGAEAEAEELADRYTSKSLRAPFEPPPPGLLADRGRRHGGGRGPRR